jgi:hypothetical protein
VSTINYLLKHPQQINTQLKANTKALYREVKVIQLKVARKEDLLQRDSCLEIKVNLKSMSKIKKTLKKKNSQ